MGTVAEADHRYEDAAASMARAAEASQALGFLGQAALHLTNLGRVELRLGDPDAAAATLDRAVVAAEEAADPRMVATARLNQARVRRRQGDDDEARPRAEAADRWFRSAGGGDGALLAECLTLALDPADAPDVGAGLERVLATARATGDVEVEVLAADALARRRLRDDGPSTAAVLLAAADAAMAGAGHRLDPADRVDGEVVRAALTATSA